MAEIDQRSRIAFGCRHAGTRDMAHADAFASAKITDKCDLRSWSAKQLGKRSLGRVRLNCDLLGGEWIKWNERSLNIDLIQTQLDMLDIADAIKQQLIQLFEQNPLIF